MEILGWHIDWFVIYGDSDEQLPLLSFDFKTHLFVPKPKKLPKFGNYSSLDYEHNRQLRRWASFTIVFLRKKYWLDFNKVYRTYTKEELTIEPDSK